MHLNGKYRIIGTGLILTILLCIFPFSSCKKFVEIDAPVNQIISDEIFKDEGLAVSAVTGIYSEMMSAGNRFSACDLTFLAGLSADELIFTPPATYRDEFVKNEIRETSHPTLVSSFWDKAYRFIYTANICLEKMYAPTATISVKTKTMLEGECRFIRAFCYFHMVNLFGPVPMPLGSDFSVNMTLPRNSVNEIYKQILEDLEIAKELLLDEYPTPERVRPNKYAVLALLAKVYLYRYDWAKAEATSTQIINNSNYSLESNLTKVFDKASPEAIWQLLPVNTIQNNTWEANIIIPPGNTFVVTDTLYKSFEPNDNRKIMWLKDRPTNVPLPGSKYYPYKYKIKSNATTKLEYYMVFRLGEQYLIRAEARAHLNKVSEAAADLNMIRSRAGLPNTPASSQDGLYPAIAQERKVELFAEWGNRWYDLKRTQKADAELKELSYKKPFWNLNDTLWPIPTSQILLNSNLTQNPGY
jgi:starch-binding outer membrane protein, SusD/RagB family